MVGKILRFYIFDFPVFLAESGGVGVCNIPTEYCFHIRRLGVQGEQLQVPPAYQCGGVGVRSIPTNNYLFKVKIGVSGVRRTPEYYPFLHYNINFFQKNSLQNQIFIVM